MDSQQIELYERILAFSLDKPDAQLTFSKRLARDNGWKLEYTQRVIINRTLVKILKHNSQTHP